MPRPAGTSTLPLVTPLSAPLAPTRLPGDGGSSAPCFTDAGWITTVVCGGRELQLLTRSPIAFCRCSRALFPSSEVSSPPTSPAAILVTPPPPAAPFSPLRGFVAPDVPGRDSRDARPADLVLASGTVELGVLGRGEGRRRRCDDCRGRRHRSRRRDIQRHGSPQPDFGGQRAVEGGRTGNGRRIGLVRRLGRLRLLLRILLLQRVLRRSALQPARQEIARFHFRNLRDRRAVSVAH